MVFLIRGIEEKLYFKMQIEKCKMKNVFWIFLYYYSM
jgi:hypothetical protein